MSAIGGKADIARMPGEPRFGMHDRSRPIGLLASPLVRFATRRVPALPDARASEVRDSPMAAEGHSL